MADRLAVFRRMLDPKNWPIRPDDVWFIHDGEVVAFVRSGASDERRMFKPLFQ